VSATPEGEALLHHASRAFSNLQRGLDAVCVTGPQALRLHCAPSFAGQWLPPRLAGLFAAFPELDLRLLADPQYPLFPSDQYDADILYGDPRQAGLIVVPLGIDQIAPMCAPSLFGRINTPADLRAMPLIESEHCRIRWSDWFEAHGVVPPAPRGPRFDRSSLTRWRRLWTALGLRSTQSASPNANCATTGWSFLWPGGRGR
jgi:LysR family transcriptional regulator, glycine cleavage system transcriptional activator